MQSALERRENMLMYLSDHRQATYEELAREFQCAKTTARRDIEILTCDPYFAPIYTVSGGAGGIFVDKDWHYGYRYLTASQEALLRKLSFGLQPEDQKTMQEILTAFARPVRQRR